MTFSKEDLREALLRSTPEERHQAILQSGKMTPLKFFDHLPWLKGGADWSGWRAFLGASFGLPLSPKEMEIFQTATGRKASPQAKAREVWMICGRRARKSAIASVIGVYVAAFKDHRPHLAPGERAQIPIIAKNTTEAKTIKDFIVAILSSSPELSHLLEGTPTAEIVRLKTRCDFAIRACSITAVRSKAIPLFIGDEIAFWHTDDAANPDRAILESVRPAMLSYGGDGMIMGLSSPYARRGVLWERFEQDFGKDGERLVWKAPTLMMHDTPEVRAEVEKAFLDDPIAAAAEYGAEFRTDVAAFVTREMLESVTGEHFEIEPTKGIKYTAFVDPSGGNSDSFTLGIAHWDPKLGSVLDLLWEKEAPFSTTEAVKEVTDLLKEYGLRRVTGDNFGGRVYQDMFRENGVTYSICKQRRTELYANLLPLINSNRCVLPNDAKLRNQFLLLDRRSLASGREIIDHPKGAHDDLCNAAAGALVTVNRYRREVEEEEAKPHSTEELFYERLWKDIRRQRGEEKTILANPYVRKR